MSVQIISELYRAFREIPTKIVTYSRMKFELTFSTIVSIFSKECSQKATVANVCLKGFAGFLFLLKNEAKSQWFRVLVAIQTEH